MTIGVIGAGAFGSALAIAQAEGGRDVVQWARTGAEAMRETRRVPRLPGVALPDAVTPTSDATDLARAKVILAAVPMQSLSGVLFDLAGLLAEKPIVACCKGVELSTGRGPTDVIWDAVPNAQPAILSGPSFAADIARGLPTALTLAADDGAEELQKALSTQTLRLYRSSDPKGVEIGGALKNVIAIACGGCIGMGLGESARAALMTRGFAEMQRLAARMGAEAETLMGLSGFGDLALTSASEMSRNYRHGLALGRDAALDAGETVEGVATAKAALELAQKLEVELPIVTQVAAVCAGQVSLAEAIQRLLSRPLRAE